MKSKEMTKDTIQDVVRKIAEVRQELNERFGVRQIGIFGSFTSGNVRPDSDVDIIVELGKPTFDNYMDLKYRLEEVLQRPVDLVMADTVKPRLRPIIEQEAFYV